MSPTINVTSGNDTINVTSGTDTINITAGATVRTVSYVDADGRFYFDGESGDTYLKYNSSTSRLELYVDGTKKQEWGA